MFGFVLGTVCLVGLCAMGTHHRRHAWAGGGCGGHRGGWGREGRFSERRRAGFAGAVVEIVKRRLRIDEEQEPFVDHAARDVRATVRTFHDELEAARSDLAGAFRGEQVDDAALEAAFGRIDEAWKVARRELVSAARQVHAVLEPDQRGTAADWVARGPRGEWVL